MPETKRSYDILTDEERRKITKQIITFFEEERDEDIGIIAAEHFLDFVLKNIGLPIHNNAIDSAKDWLKEKLKDIEIDSDELKNKNTA